MDSLSTPLAELSFDKHERILHIRIKEGAEMTLENAERHYDSINKITENEKYLALVDATEHFTVDQDAWKYASQKNVAGNRIAVAHYNSSSANKLTMNFFKSVYNTAMPVQIFRSETEARNWLSEFKGWTKG